MHAYSGKDFTPIKTKWSESSVSFVYININSHVSDVIIQAFIQVVSEFTEISYSFIHPYETFSS